MDKPTVKHAWCKMCGPARTNCSTLCTIEDGCWTHVEGNPVAGNNGRWDGGTTLCAKGNAALQVLDSPNRILYPMRRIGKKGEGRFERITWEEALGIVAEKLKVQKMQYGPESFGVLSPQYYAVLGTVGRRFLNVHGSPNYLHSGICATQRKFSRLVTIGGATLKQATAIGPGQMSKTKLLVSWGYNPENSAVNQGSPSRRLDAMKSGMQVIDIRPLQDALASKANIWVPVRPGTDCALALAFLNVIIGEKLYDGDFVHTWCAGFDELASHVKQFTSAWASAVTGVPAAQIEQVARLMGTVKPMAIELGNGIGDQQSDGHWAVACACLIEAITGNLGIAGGGGASVPPLPSLVKLNKIDLLSERLLPTEEDEKNGWMPGVSKLVAPETPRWFQTMTTQESGPTSAYNRALQSILTANPYPLRCVFAQSTNPLSATRQPQLIVRALERLDFYVVMDVEWNSSCAYADIVLPACTQYEASDQIAVKNGPDGTFVGINQVLQEPAGESRSDWQFYLDLAVKMGYGKDFWNGSLDAMLRAQLEGSGITLEELREKGFVFRRRDEQVVAGEPLYQDYAKMFASLPHGKVQCFNEVIGGKPDAQDEGVLGWLPAFRGPAESPVTSPEIAKQYPLVFSDVHAHRLCNHSYYHNVPYLRELQPYPWVKINPTTAREYGIEDGGRMVVESPHGRVRMVACYCEGVAPGVLMSKRGWPPASLGGFDDAEVNVLYGCDPACYDRFHSAMGKQTMVRIERDKSFKACASHGATGGMPVLSPRASVAIETLRTASGCAARNGAAVCAASPGTKPPALGEADCSRALPSDGSNGRGGDLAAAEEHDRFGFYVDTGRCIKCFACEVACKQWHGIAAQTHSRRKVEEAVEGRFPLAIRTFVSLSCMHCEHPACLAACGAGAIGRREDGTIVVVKERCAGCGACQVACPYGVPTMVAQPDGSLVMDKCDACFSLGREVGQSPRCVATCPTHALRFGSLRDLHKDTVSKGGLFMQGRMGPAVLLS